MFIPRIGPLEVFSMIVASIGICVVVWVSVTFVRRGKGTAVPLLPPTQFVAIGLYRFVRNPMYIGLLLVIIAETIFFRSVWLLIYASLFWLAVHCYVVLIEEPDLKRRFGASYMEYLTATPRWIPRPLRHNVGYRLTSVSRDEEEAVWL
jgi:protein-S-isoprenylcysteine O-methyltransferase Ste14